MSNTAVGAIYKKIIDAVADSSKTDFEEYGVPNDVLVALQDGWQNRLSESKRAAFPWDPQPEPRAAPNPVKAEQHSQSNNVPSPAISNQNAYPPVQIKQEPAYDTSYLNPPQSQPYPSTLGQPQYAHQRAAQLLQKQFGNQATESITAIQAAQMGLPGVQQRSQGYQQLTVQEQQQQQQHRTVPQKQEAPYIKQEAGQDTLSFSQTDGAGDVPSGSIQLGPSGYGSGHGIMRQHVNDMAQRLEAGGLLVPLDERQHSRPAQDSRLQSGSSVLAGPSHTRGLPQTDGPGDDDEEDEDAINSDLDDPNEDPLEGNVETDFAGDVILCLYDKVQRVKNKWKCTLKDGVVTVDGKDYVFHKAQGEFEW